MCTKVLCVDDDANILAAYQRSLRNSFQIEIAQSGPAGLEKIISEGPYAVIMSDMTMPGMNGIDFLSRSREIAPESVRMMLTGNADLKTAIDALHQGNIFKFLVKPCSSESLNLALESGIQQYRLITAERELLERTLRGSVRVLIEILSTVSPSLFGRAQQLRQDARTLATALGEREVWSIELAAMFSQIGVMTMPPTMLQKLQSKMLLTEAEREIVVRLPEISHNLIANIPRLESSALAILYSRKNYDGTGFPDHDIQGPAIPIGGRILRILTDIIERTTSGVTVAGAITLMQRSEGIYDPGILQIARQTFVECHDPLAIQNATVAVSVRELSLGHVIASEVMGQDGETVATAGLTVTETLMERIRNVHELTGVHEPIYVRKYHGLQKRAA